MILHPTKDTKNINLVIILTVNPKKQNDFLLFYNIVHQRFMNSILPKTPFLFLILKLPRSHSHSHSVSASHSASPPAPLQQ